MSVQRLIDANALKEQIDYYIKEAGWSEHDNRVLGWCKEFIDNAPTISVDMGVDSGDSTVYTRPQGDCISREAINLEIEKRYCSKHCVLPSEEPYCPDNCPARFLKNIVKECPTVPQVVVFAENADEKAIEDMKAELQNVIDSERPQGEWINSGVDISGHRLNRCSICNGVYQMSYVGDSITRWNYCPNCGADMRGDAE